MRVLFIFLKGSGSLVFVGKDPASGRVGTAQSAPSFSTPMAAAASVEAIVTAPANESVTAVVSAMTLERILERPKLMITRALPSRWGVGAQCVNPFESRQRGRRKLSKNDLELPG
ncbi:hypothetical protein Aph01nite_67010 [Acrocarpospora phusangensis]|uniref:Uncharacterized protein n=1 Tax=Acrocarpospora phusangensis TaxID=1070424 RepID=A0A919QGH0_9ACTN|nr:hypothetical protein Aph01nite_67010 [Acrocarpospora phusangensis]